MEEIKSKDTSSILPLWYLAVISGIKTVLLSFVGTGCFAGRAKSSKYNCYSSIVCVHSLPGDLKCSIVHTAIYRRPKRSVPVEDRFFMRRERRMMRVHKPWLMVFSYATAHFLIDFACAFLMFGSIAGMQDWYVCVLLFNFLRLCPANATGHPGGYKSLHILYISLDDRCIIH